MRHRQSPYLLTMLPGWFQAQTGDKGSKSRNTVFLWLCSSLSSWHAKGCWGGTRTEFQSPSWVDRVTNPGTSPPGFAGSTCQTSDTRSRRSQQPTHSAPRLSGTGASERRARSFHHATQALISGNLAREQNQTQAEHALPRRVFSQLRKESPSRHLPIEETRNPGKVFLCC